MGCCHVPRIYQEIRANTPKSPRVKRHSFVKKKNSARIKDFQLISKCGSGGFGVVFKAKDKKTGLLRAIKCIEKSKMMLSHIYHEIEILKHLDHPNIVQIFEFIEEEDYCYIVMELCEGPNLFSRVSTMPDFSEAEAAAFTEQILSATAHCHEQGVTHRDIKPENILFESSDSSSLIKIIDFGLADRVINFKLGELAGTPYFIAPEVINRNYDEKCDIWSIGVVVYIMLSGKVPFAARNTQLLFEKIKRAVFNFNGPEWSKISATAKDFIQRLLKKNPEDRMSAREALVHPWIRMQVEKNLRGDPDNAGLLMRLSTYQSKQKLRQAMLSFIASHLCGSPTHLTRLFSTLDKNGDGKISKTELLEGFSTLNLGGLEDVQRVMDHCDVDCDGFIDYSEFITASINWEKELNYKNLHAAFRELNISQAEGVNIDDIRRFIGEDDVISTEYIKEMLKEADRNGDGYIDLDEFLHVMINDAN